MKSTIFVHVCVCVCGKKTVQSVGDYNGGGNLPKYLNKSDNKKTSPW